MRTARVRLGDFEATFDGEQFTSDDESLANVLNSALNSWKAGVRGIKTDYWPDPLVNLAEAIAKYCGGELIRFDPMEGPEPPEGAVF